MKATTRFGMAGGGMNPGSKRGMSKRVPGLIAMAAIAIALVTALLPGVAGADSPYSTISPQTPQANDIQGIYKLTFWLALVVFVGVQIGIVYTALRYRRRGDDDERPEQTHGNPKLEIIWTIIPAIVLLIVFVPTVRTIYAHDEELDDPDMIVEVYG